MAVIGKLTALIGADTKQFEAAVTKLQGPLGSLGSKAASVAKTASLAAAGAAGGLAVAGTKMFADFERGMNEVFTLMPSMSADAMGKMEGDVKKFAGAMGVLPSKVVPALYQSISAGVPADNVFSFLETAQKAAVGGVTSLETAVDGISSAVNAYGIETLSAGQAADQMFTAVKLGKTNFEQLSQAMADVAPIGASVGVSFGDTQAALAAMTSQGAKTQVAATYLKGAMVELSKEGTIASDNFKKLAGKSFKQFVAEGGNLHQALQFMEAGARAANMSVVDLFGSVEAGQAATMLTGKGAQTFANNIKAMGEAAGASSAAYDQMNQGVGRAFENLRAQASVALIELGDRLAPGITALANLIQSNMPQIEAVINTAFDGITATFAFFSDTVIPKAMAAFNWIKQNISTAGPAIAAVLLAIIVPAFYAWAASAASAAAATMAAMWPVIGVAGLVGAAVYGLMKAWQSFGSGIMAVLSSVWEANQRWLVPVGKVLTVVLGGAIAITIGILWGLWQAVKAVVGGVAGAFVWMVGTVGKMLGGLATMFGKVVSWAIDAFSPLIEFFTGLLPDKLVNGGREIINSIIRGLIEAARGIPLIGDRVAGWLEDKLVGKPVQAKVKAQAVEVGKAAAAGLNLAAPAIDQAAADLGAGFAPALAGQVGKAGDTAAKTLGEKFADLASGFQLGILNTKEMGDFSAMEAQLRASVMQTKDLEERQRIQQTLNGLDSFRKQQLDAQAQAVLRERGAMVELMSMGKARASDIAAIAAREAEITKLLNDQTLSAEERAKYEKEIAGIKDAKADMKESQKGGLAKFADNAIGTIMGQLQHAFGPMAVLMPIINKALEALQPALDALIFPILEVVGIFAKALMPLFKALFPVFKLLAIAATYAGQILLYAFSFISNIVGALARAVGGVIRGIGKAIDAIPGVSGESIIKAGQGLVDYGNSMHDNAREMRAGAKELGNAREDIKKMSFDDALAETSNSADKVSKSLTNLPKGFKIAAAQFQASAGQASSLTSAPARSAGNGAAGSKATTIQQDNSTVIQKVEIVAPKGTDPKELWEAVQHEARRQGMRSGVSTLAPEYA